VLAMGHFMAFANVMAWRVEEGDGVERRCPRMPGTRSVEDDADADAEDVDVRECRCMV